MTLICQGETKVFPYLPSKLRSKQQLYMYKKVKYRAETFWELYNEQFNEYKRHKFVLQAIGANVHFLLWRIVLFFSNRALKNLMYIIQSF